MLCLKRNKNTFHNLCVAELESNKTFRGVGSGVGFSNNIMYNSEYGNGFNFMTNAPG